MWKMIVRRFLILIPQLLIISMFVFILGTLMPGDALSGLVDPTLKAADIQKQRELLGLDDPLPVRYVSWISKIVFEQDFGQSFTYKRSVTDVIGDRVSNTFWLSLTILILTYLIAIPLGIIAGRFGSRWPDKAILFYVFVALSMPTLVLGILMILNFAFKLGLFPSGGSVNAIVLSQGTDLEILINRVRHMVLPATTGGLLNTIGIIFMLRANIVDRTASEYVKLARSKGVPTRVIFNKHILRNSIIPVTAGIGFAIAGLLMGVLFIEQIFMYPGIGALFFQSVVQRDFPVVNALILLFSALTATGMLISDILLTIVDPRIQVQ